MYHRFRFKNFHFAICHSTSFFLSSLVLQNCFTYGIRVQILTHDSSAQHELRCGSDEQVYLIGFSWHRIAFGFHATFVASRMPVRLECDVTKTQHMRCATTSHPECGQWMHICELVDSFKCEKKKQIHLRRTKIDLIDLHRKCFTFEP